MNQAAPAETATAPASRGRVAILKENLPVGGMGVSEGIASSPDDLAAALGRAGFVARCLGAGELSDTRLLKRADWDVLILPYGPAFPVQASAAVRQFLHEGGKFIGVGGYAFDHLVEREGTQWQPYVPKPPAGPADARWRFEIPADRIRSKGTMTCSAWARSEGIIGAQFAFMAVYQLDAGGKVVEFKDFAQLRGTRPWQHYTYAFRVNDRTNLVMIYAGMWDCAGQAWFDDLRLVDAQGQPVLNTAVGPQTNGDVAAPMTWCRSEKGLCEVVPSERRASERGLKIRLNHAVVEERMNTRHGRPEDGLRVEPTQLGVFDPDYRLMRVHSVRPAPDQTIFPAGWSIEGTDDKGIEGYAACGVLGHNQARWRPLINGLDRYGRLRGAAGSLIHHYAGSWKGSTWVLFGLTTHDVFATGRSGGQAALVRLVEHLVCDTYLISVAAEKPFYNQAEKARITTRLFNGGRQPSEVEVRVSVIDEAGGEVVHRHTQPLTVTPNSEAKVEFDWVVRAGDQGFHRIRAEMDVRSPKPGGASLSPPAAATDDVVEGGLIVRNDRILAAGPRLTYRDNYLRVNDRPTFLFGTDDWSYVFGSDRETPLQWRRDMEKRRDFGVTIYENLQIGLPASPQQQDRFFNQVDGLVQLTQQFNQVYFPCLLCGYDVSVDDATLRKHAEFAGAYAQRFARVPGLIYYLNGDLQCHVRPAVQPQLAPFLRSRYADDRALQAAWNSPDLGIDKVLAEEYSETGANWSDVRAYDLNLFRAHLIRRWQDTLIEAIRKHDTTHPTASEFYQLPWQGVDVPAGIGQVDLSNIGFFEEPERDIQRLPLLLKYSDLRSRGKSFGPGEYGVKTHPAWRDPLVVGYHKARTNDQAMELFLAIAHYTLGLGGSRIHNWCWKDGSEGIFPWGMVYPCDEVEKDTACVHRNQSLLFRRFRPVYQPPAVYVMTPDTHRLGGQKMKVIEGILASIQLALGAHVDSLGTLNEHHMVIPPGARVIYLPMPFCLSDAAYNQLLGFVRSGGTLYLSGDVSFDALRRRTHPERLAELCGVRFLRSRYEGIDPGQTQRLDLWPADGALPILRETAPCIDVESAGATPLYRTHDGRPVVVHHRLGKGHVVLTTDPIELRTDRMNLWRHVDLYRRVLAIAGCAPVPLQPDEPLLHVMRQPLDDGGDVQIVFNNDPGASCQQVSLPVRGGQYQMGVRRNRPALVWHDGRGLLRAAEVQGELRVNGQTKLTDTTDGIVLTLDGAGISESRAILLMPLRAGTVRIASKAQWQDPIVDIGDLRGGRWRSYEQGVPRGTPGEMTVDVAPHQALSLLLLCPRSDLAEVRQHAGQ